MRLRDAALSFLGLDGFGFSPLSLLPYSSKSAKSITDVAPMWSVTPAKCLITVSRAQSLLDSLRMVVQRLRKKLKEF